MIFEDFDDLCDGSLDDFLPVQREFERIYSPSTWDDWFYDRCLGIVHFATKDLINTRFQCAEIATYSEDNHMWKWTWGNSRVSPHARKVAEKVLEYGQKHLFAPLTMSEFETDVNGCSLLALVSAKLSNAIAYMALREGVYSTFVVIVNELSEDVVEVRERTCCPFDIDSDEIAMAICRHLPESRWAGFSEMISNEGERVAWCDKCLELYASDDEIDIDEEVGLKHICHQCYFDAKRRNHFDDDNVEG